jgi:hypothetical protein
MFPSLRNADELTSAALRKQAPAAEPEEAEADATLL